jgi:phosphatidylglycerophosphatase C
MSTVAAFDFDGTLTTGDTLMPFLRQVCGTPRVGVALARHPWRAVRALRSDGRDAFKEAVLHDLLVGHRYDELAAAGVRYAAEVERAHLRPAVVARLRWHHQQGHEVIIVSASLRCYLDRIGAALGADAVLCTELEVDGNGRCTGALVGGNCRGATKAERVLARYGGLPDVMWAYGDSSGDTELLALADHPVRVGNGPLPPVVEHQ